MFSPGDAEQLLADAAGDLEVVGQLGVGQLALVESVDLLRKLGVIPQKPHRKISTPCEQMSRGFSKTMVFEKSKEETL